MGRQKRFCRFYCRNLILTFSGQRKGLPAFEPHFHDADKLFCAGALFILFNGNIAFKSLHLLGKQTRWPRVNPIGIAYGMGELLHTIPFLIFSSWK
jgi:hypothetical protein